MRFQLAERGKRRSGVRGRDGRGEDERAGAVAHEVGYAAAGGHIAAEGSKRLGERAHVDIDMVFKAIIAGCAAASLADDAEAVRVVDHDACAVFLRQRADLGQVGNVAAHGEHAVGHDQAARRLRHLLELLFKVCHIVVLVAQHLAVGQLAAVIEAGMVLTVHDDIVMQADNGADDAEIGLEARREGHDGVLAQKFCKLVLQLQMQLERAVQETGAGAAGAERLIGVHTGFDDCFVRCQAEIVVGAEHDAALTLHNDLGILPGFERVEIGIDAQIPDLILNVALIAFFENIHSVLLRYRSVPSASSTRSALQSSSGVNCAESAATFFCISSSFSSK